MSGSPEATAGADRLSPAEGGRLPGGRMPTLVGRYLHRYRETHPAEVADIICREIRGRYLPMTHVSAPLLERFYLSTLGEMPDRDLTSVCGIGGNPVPTASPPLKLFRRF